MATKAQIAAWLDMMYADGYSHMLVVRDSFDNHCYPIYVQADENVEQTVSTYNAKSMQHVVELYAASHDRDAQLDEMRAWHAL